MAAAPVAPYWGNLDPPLISRQDSTRKTGNNGGSNARNSAQYPPSQSRPHRISTQSQAPTVSTQSPFVSPTASSFQADGLAPRPPSFPYSAAENYNRDYLEKRRRRASREAEEFYRGNGYAAPPPAAPDVPRAPPLSYKQPLKNSTSPTSYRGPARSKSTREAEIPVGVGLGVSAGSYLDGPTEAKILRSRVELEQPRRDSERRRAQGSISREPDQPRDDLDRAVPPGGSDDTTRERAEYYSSKAAPRSRKESTGEVEAQRRREWAPDRSPLQRLELTLDSITKEEKRARVEEAELLAREAKAGRGGERLNQNSVRLRNKSIAKAPEVTSIIPKPEPQNLTEAGLVRSLSSKQKDDLRRSGKVERKKPTEPDSKQIRQLGKGFEYTPQLETAAPARDLEKASTPTRGPSFRERAAITAAAAGFAGVTAGAGLSRSTSNKLKKEPPGDPWFSRRLEAERAFPEVTLRRPSVETRRDPRNTTGGPLGSAPVITASRNQPPVAPKEELKHSAASPPVEAAESDSEEEYLYPPNAKRNLSKIEQLTGHKISTAPIKRMLPQQEQLNAGDINRSKELGLENGKQSQKSKEAISAKGINDLASPEAANAMRGLNGHRHFPNVPHIGHHRRNQYRPGDGLYAPHKPLEEWKKGIAAVLAGPLLDLDVRQTDAEKDKAWWEVSTGRRRSSTAKQRKVETYDGEQEDSNGMALSTLSNSMTGVDIPFPTSGGTIAWSSMENSVVHLTRQHKAYPESPSTETEATCRRKSYLTRKATVRIVPKIRVQGAGGHAFHIILSYSSDCSKSYKHNIFHPFHICSITSSHLDTKLTPVTRQTRVPTTAPTKFSPPLYLKCGPLLRYCGLRQTPSPSLPGQSLVRGREMWRGSIMIATTDSQSSYETAPTLRLFAQPMDLLPAPPHQVDGGADEHAPENVDPVAGLPKIGRDGKTLYVRPVEQLLEEKDLSKDESEEGLFERHRSIPDGVATGHDGTLDPENAIAGHNQRNKVDGEKLGKYIETPGFRLHAEQGTTFWRFNIEIELRDLQQRIAYRINRGPATGFWVPARGQSMNIMFHSCNGFSRSVNPDQFSGPDPMWRDVLNTHQSQPFHVMIGGGDQIYNDAVMESANLFSKWLSIKNPLEKHNAPFTLQMQEELEACYLERYAMWFSRGLFGLANSQIPMVNIFDDHDIIDGYGSYPDSFMETPVFAGLGAIAFKYYMLFQHQSIIDEGEETEPSWLLGTRPGPYIKELSRSVFMFLGSNIAFLGLDGRTERTPEDVVTDDTYDKIFNRMHKEIIKGETKHLIVLLGVPIAYPRLVWLENILTSRAMDPIKAMGRTAIFSNLVGQIDGGVEVLDDLNDHWTAKNHKLERKQLIEDLQDLAAEKSVRITILSGDVHLAAIGQFFSSPKLGVPKDKDFRYMPNVISSAIVNSPPPNAMADILNKRNKIHHFDERTDESMIPIFGKDVNGLKRNNKRLLPRRNWCSIREYNPNMTPPPTPPGERSPSPPPQGGILRRLSLSRGPSYRPDAGPPQPRGMTRNFSFGSRRSTELERPSYRSDAGPPPSGGLFRGFSLRGRPSTDPERPGIRGRTLSLSRKDFLPGNLFRRGSKRRPDDGGINGYGASSDEDESPDQDLPLPRLRGGAGDDGYFTPDAAAPFKRTRVGRSTVVTQNHDDGYDSYDESPDQQNHNHRPSAPVTEPARRPFHRTPTGITEKQRRQLGVNHEVNLEGGLDICLNVEVSQKDPAGITVPYRLLVPALWYEDTVEVHDHRPVVKKETGLKRLMSLRQGKGGKADSKGKVREEFNDEDYAR